MAYLKDVEQLKTGLIIYRRPDVKHQDWYCRIKLANERRYKTLALGTSDVKLAREKAFEQETDFRFRKKHELPVFNKTFAKVAAEYSAFQKQRSDAGQIAFHRWRVLDSHIKTQLNRYIGNVQITSLGQDRWENYPVWRQANGKGRTGGRVSEATIRSEMGTLREVMSYAANKKYIHESQVFKGRLPTSKARREEFTPAEYRHLHTYARKWMKESRIEDSWARKMVYHFILVMTNTGMRTMEARNLKWRDIHIQTDKQGRQFVRINVRGKGKFRELVAASNVATYLQRIKEFSNATELDDFVFTTEKGKPARTLYYGTVERLLMDAKLLHSVTGNRRSSYCFRHTYATFRLTEGVDVYFLAKQMGTSVQMIEKHYGHITPVKNAERILQGMPGWEPAPAAT